MEQISMESKKDAYPLPNMSGTLDVLRLARFNSTIDLGQAYSQIALEDNSRELTEFAVPGMGHYLFKRMSYGFSAPPGMFQNLLDSIIGPELAPYAYAYLNDNSIVRETFEHNLDLLKKILIRIQAPGQTINTEK